jgi:ribosomal protein L37AE/L43A
MAKKKEKAVPVVVEEPEEIEEEEVTCPVCGKPVGLDVAECPHCGAEFEEEEIEEIIEEAPESPVQAKPEPQPAVEEEPVYEDEMAECPVCGKMVSLNVSACPNCGAEFEEEEVEEIIEVEEPHVTAAPARKESAKAAPHLVSEEEEVEVEEEVEAEPAEIETNITDLRVIGIALIVLGILGSQISFMIDWYYTWVPPIGDNLGMFIAIPAVVIVVALLVFLLLKKSAGEGKKVPMQMPGMSLSLFLFGILALVMIMLWNPINDALQSSNTGVGVAFVLMLVVGIVMVFMKMRTESRATA